METRNFFSAFSRTPTSPALMVEVVFFIPLIVVGFWIIIIVTCCCVFKNKCAVNQQVLRGNVIMVNGNTNRIYPAQTIGPITGSSIINHMTRALTLISLAASLTRSSSDSSCHEDHHSGISPPQANMMNGGYPQGSMQYPMMQMQPGMYPVPMNMAGQQPMMYYPNGAPIYPSPQQQGQQPMMMTMPMGGAGFQPTINTENDMPPSFQEATGDKY